MTVRKVAGWGLTILGLVFIVLGIWEFVQQVLLMPAPNPAPVPEPGSAEGFAGIILAIAGFVRALSHAPHYVNATVLGVLLVLVGQWLVSGSERA